MYNITELDDDSLRRHIRLCKMRNSVRYSCELLDKEIKRKLSDTNMLVRRILSNYLNMEINHVKNIFVMGSRSNELDRIIKKYVK